MTHRNVPTRSLSVFNSSFRGGIIIFVIGFLFLFSTTDAQRVAPRAGENLPEKDAAGAAAVAAVVIAAVGGLAAWINSQDDDCYGAALGAAWGQDCTLEQNEHKDADWTDLFVSAEADNDCAHGWGGATAWESALGAWAGSGISPICFAWTKRLHPGTENDYHKGRGWAQCGVDNEVRATNKETPLGAKQWNRNAGEVIAQITIESLVLASVNRRDSSVAKWRIEVMIDSTRIFLTQGHMDQHGQLAVEGDIDPSLFITNLKSGDETWQTELHDYVLEIPVDTLDTEAPDSVDLLVTINSELEAMDELAGPSDIPTLTEWGLIIFGVVLLGFITWVFLKRRRVIGARI